MKREELIKELRTCANCTSITANACPYERHCQTRRENLMLDAAEMLEGKDDESKTE